MNEQGRLRAAVGRIQTELLDSRSVDLHWVGELSLSALSTATTISAFSFYLKSEVPSEIQRIELIRLVELAIQWLMEEQNDDGGWGDTDKSYSNISTTMLVEAALTAAGQAADYSEAMDRARGYIAEQGGVPGLRARYGKDKTFAVPILANCAMSGLVPWSEVSVLPFEAACVPQRCYHLMQMPVVSYAIPALVAIGQAKYVQDPPRNPISRMIRGMSVRRSLRVLERMQPSTGGFLEAAPLTGFVAMGLIHANQASHPVVRNGIRFLQESFREVITREGSRSAAVPIDTNLATWVTTLSVNALFQSPGEMSRDPELWQPTLDWILSCQHLEPHPFTGANPGGWGWSDLSGAVPDSDDTPGAMLALRQLYEHVDFDDSVKAGVLESVRMGAKWLLGLQNRDGGWPTFCRGWGKLPFDRSGMDLTAHVLRAFVAWRTEIGDSRMEKAIERGFEYLDKGQRPDGTWLPLWFGNQDESDEENPVYGTVKVLLAYRDAGRFDTKTAQDGLEWLRKNQNLDGGWGGGLSLDWQLKRLGRSSVEETGLAVEMLLADSENEFSRSAAESGVAWLLASVESEGVSTSSPIGFYFAKLWYYEKLYPLIFAASALATALETSKIRELRIDEVTERSGVGHN